MTYIWVKHDITLNVDILKFIIWKKNIWIFRKIKVSSALHIWKMIGLRYIAGEPFS